MPPARCGDDLQGVAIDLRQPPEFDYGALFDDNDDPSEVIIFDEGEADEGEPAGWIACDHGDAIAQEAWR